VPRHRPAKPSPTRMIPAPTAQWCLDRADECSHRERERPPFLALCPLLDTLVNATRPSRSFADTRRQRRYLGDAFHWCGPGLRFNIFSMLPRAMIPMIMMPISVEGTRPSHHHQLRADGDLPKRKHASGHGTCRCGPGEHTKSDQGRENPHGMLPQQGKELHAGGQPRDSPTACSPAIILAHGARQRHRQKVSAACLA